MRRDLATERRQAQHRQSPCRHGDGHVVALRALPADDALFSIDANDFTPTSTPSSEEVIR